ncbi:MAG TPA: phage portal protein [Clostridiales bacterium]|nr:phage portal protein [Clostridiales bacterium]
MDVLGGSKSIAGASVNEQTAMRSTAVLSCVRVISETLASLPLNIYKSTKGSKDKVDNVIYELLHNAPNPYTTSFNFREVMQSNLLLYGNAYAEIDYDSNGNIVALWHIPAWRVQVYKARDGDLVYKITLEDGTEKTLQSYRVLHIAGLRYNGLMGFSPIQVARESIGLALATEEFGSRFFGQGTNVGGVVEHPSALGEKAYKNLKESLNETYAGLGNSHRLLLLEEGMKYSRSGIPPNDAQFIESRKFQIEEIARIFRVPLHMIGHLEHATFSNIEHQSIEFVVHTIRPYLVRWEQAIKMKLFKATKYYAEFNVEGLLRGDVKSRYDAYAVGRQWGWLSVNDIREKENMAKLPTDVGDKYLTPLNMTILGEPKGSFLNAKNTDEGGDDSDDGNGDTSLQNSRDGT